MLYVIRNSPTPGSQVAARDEPALQSRAVHASARWLPAEWDGNASWFHLAAAPPCPGRIVESYLLEKTDQKDSVCQMLAELQWK